MKILLKSLVIAHIIHSNDKKYIRATNDQIK